MRNQIKDIVILKFQKNHINMLIWATYDIPSQAGHIKEINTVSKGERF